MTPGPLGLNCATFAGMKTAGFLGAIVANMGILMPTFTITFVVAAFFERFKASSAMQVILAGVRPACIGMILGVCLSLSMTNYFPGGSLSLPCVVLGVLDLYLLLRRKIGIPKVICINALAGFVLFGVIGL